MRLTDAEIARYHEQGFLLVDILDEAEAIALRAEIDRILGWDPSRVGHDTGFHSSENQHFGDDLDGYGRQSKHYYFHLITDQRFLPIQHVFHHLRVFAAVESILGAPLILDNASLFAAEPGTAYQLGWHRDVIQIPQEQIDEAAIYRAERFHNSVQINLPLHEDDTLWVVPGSHRRPNSAAENAAFAGSKHYAPLGARMPGAINVRMRPGQAALYNNNLIHTGHQERFRLPRRSLHLGYHCAAKPPTWHFYLLNERMFTDDFRARMSPRVRAMIDDYFACRRQHPRMEDTWTADALRATTIR